MSPSIPRSLILLTLALACSRTRSDKPAEDAAIGRSEGDTEALTPASRTLEANEGSTADGERANEPAEGAAKSAAAPAAESGEGSASAQGTAPGAAAVEEAPARTPDVVYVPTPQDVVDKMLELARVKKGDLVYDLGCGDGRIVVTAAKRYGVQAVGFDIDPQRVAEARANVEKNNVGNLVRIEQKDIFTLDLSPASVVTLYLLPDLNVKLIPQLERLKPGSRVVSHDFSMGDIQPVKHVELFPKDSDREHEVFLWTTPLQRTASVQKPAAASR